MFKQFYDQIAESQQEKSWFLITGSYLLDFVIIIFLMFVVYPNNWLSPIEYATQGIFNTTLVASIALFGIIIIVLLCVVGKVKLRDLGLKGSKLPIGIISFFGFYIILNIILLIINVAVKNPTIWHPYWLDSGSPGLTWDVGSLLAQIFGNVLLEETLFRGFLWIQFSKKFADITRSKTWGLILGAVVSNFLFSLLHIPSLIARNYHGFQLVPILLLLFLIGVLFTSVYFITENLYIAMTVHVFYNISFVLFYAVFPIFLLVIFITIAGLVVWGYIKTRMRKEYKEKIE